MVRCFAGSQELGRQVALDDAVASVDKHLDVLVHTTLVQVVHTFFKVRAYAVQPVGMQPPRAFLRLCCPVGREQGLVP